VLKKVRNVWTIAAVNGVAIKEEREKHPSLERVWKYLLNGEKETQKPPETVEEQAAKMNISQLRAKILEKETDMPEKLDLYNAIRHEFLIRQEEVAQAVKYCWGDSLVQFVGERMVKVLRQGEVGAGEWREALGVEEHIKETGKQEGLGGYLKCILDDELLNVRLGEMDMNSEEWRDKHTEMRKLRTAILSGVVLEQNVLMKTDWKKYPGILFEESSKRMLFAKISPENPEAQKAAVLVDNIVDPKMSEWKYSRAHELWQFIAKGKKEFVEIAQRITANTNRLMAEAKYDELVLEEKADLIAREVMKEVGETFVGEEKVYGFAVATAVETLKSDPDNKAARDIKKLLLLSDE
jgi:hypothetical protein